MPVAYNEQPQVHVSSSEPARHNLESGRYDTFDNQWPHPDGTLCSKKRMAKAGFYFTGKKDCVKCFVCLIKLEGWDPHEDEPWQKHLEASPTCEFAKLGKEEGQMSVEQWLDIFCGQAMHALESKISAIVQVKLKMEPSADAPRNF